MSGLRPAVFAEAMATHLCLPSPGCADYVGEKIGRTRVDVFGDKVQAAALPGDGFRTKHDTVKMLIHRLCVWSKLSKTSEVFGLFSHLIPQEGLNRIERGRKRQAIVPNFRIEYPNEMVGGKLVLAELKMLVQTRRD